MKLQLTFNTRTIFVVRLSDLCGFHAYLKRGEGWKGFACMSWKKDGVGYFRALHIAKFVGSTKQDALKYVQEHEQELMREVKELESKQN